MVDEEGASKREGRWMRKESSKKGRLVDEEGAAKREDRWMRKEQQKGKAGG